MFSDSDLDLMNYNDDSQVDKGENMMISTTKSNLTPKKSYRNHGAAFLESSSLRISQSAHLAAPRDNSATAKRPSVRFFESESLLSLDRKMQDLKLYESPPKNKHQLPLSALGSVTTRTSDNKDAILQCVLGVDAILAAMLNKYNTEQADLTTEKMLADKQIWVKFALDVFCEWRWVQYMSLKGDFIRVFAGVLKLEDLVKDVMKKGAYPSALAELLEGLAAFERLWSECREGLVKTYVDGRDRGYGFGVLQDWIGDRESEDGGSNDEGRDRSVVCDDIQGDEASEVEDGESDESMEYIPLSSLSPNIIKVHEIKLDDDTDSKNSSKVSSPIIQPRQRARSLFASSNKHASFRSPASSPAGSSRLISKTIALHQDNKKLIVADSVVKQQKPDLEDFLGLKLTDLADTVQVLNGKADAALQSIASLDTNILQHSRALTDVKMISAQNMIVHLSKYDDITVTLKTLEEQVTDIQKMAEATSDLNTKAMSEQIETLKSKNIQLSSELSRCIDRNEALVDHLFAENEIDDHNCEAEEWREDMWSALWPQGDPDMEDGPCQEIETEVEGIIQAGRGKPSPGFCVVM